LVVTKLGGSRKLKSRGFDDFQFRVDTGHLRVRAAEGAHYQEIVLRFRQNNPLATASPDE
jgi:hypothetical protein